MSDISRWYTVPVYVKMVEDHMIVDRLREYEILAHSAAEAQEIAGWIVYREGWPYEIRKSLIQLNTKVYATSDHHAQVHDVLR